MVISKLNAFYNPARDVTESNRGVGFGSGGSLAYRRYSCVRRRLAARRCYFFPPQQNVHRGEVATESWHVNGGVRPLRVGVYRAPARAGLLIAEASEMVGPIDLIGVARVVSRCSPTRRIDTRVTLREARRTRTCGTETINKRWFSGTRAPGCQLWDVFNSRDTSVGTQRRRFALRYANGNCWAGFRRPLVLVPYPQAFRGVLPKTIKLSSHHGI